MRPQAAALAGRLDAGTDDLARRFLEVTNLVDTTLALLRPSMAWRVLRGGHFAGAAPVAGRPPDRPTASRRIA